MNEELFDETQAVFEASFIVYGLIDKVDHGSEGYSLLARIWRQLRRRHTEASEAFQLSTYRERAGS